MTNIYKPENVKIQHKNISHGTVLFFFFLYYIQKSFFLLEIKYLPDQLVTKMFHTILSSTCYNSLVIDTSSYMQKKSAVVKVAASNSTKETKMFSQFRHHEARTTLRKTTCIFSWVLHTLLKTPGTN